MTKEAAGKGKNAGKKTAEKVRIQKLKQQKRKNAGKIAEKGKNVASETAEKR